MSVQTGRGGGWGAGEALVSAERGNADAASRKRRTARDDERDEMLNLNCIYTQDPARETSRASLAASRGAGSSRSAPNVSLRCVRTCGARSRAPHVRTRSSSKTNQATFDAMNAATLRFRPAAPGRRVSRVALFRGRGFAPVRRRESPRRAPPSRDDIRRGAPLISCERALETRRRDLFRSAGRSRVRRRGGRRRRRRRFLVRAADPLVREGERRRRRLVAVSADSTAPEPSARRRRRHARDARRLIRGRRLDASRRRYGFPNHRAVAIAVAFLPRARTPTLAIGRSRRR